jgi:hypothetical protein
MHGVANRYGRASDGISVGESCVRYFKRPFAVVTQGENYFRGTSASRPCTDAFERDLLKLVLRLLLPLHQIRLLLVVTRGDWTEAEPWPP